MTNLPVISNTPTPGNAAGAAQTDSAADSRITKGPLRNGIHSAQLSVEGGLSAFVTSLGDAPLAEAAEPFAALLARQISGVDSSSTNVAPGAIALDGATPPPMDEQDQAAIVGNTPGDQSGALAALLLQLSLPEDRGQRTEDRNEGAAQPHNNQSSAISLLSSDAVKRVDLPASLTQPGPNIAQAIASPAMSAFIPDALTNNRVADAPQTITIPLGNNGWADEFSQKISWMITRQNQVAELHLNPPDLGPLDVVLKISDNQATALFTSPHGAVRDAIDNALPKLRDMLADNGIMLGNATVSDQPPRDRSAEQFMNQGSGAAAQHKTPDDASKSTGLSPATAQAAPTRRHNGMVDTFA